MSQPFASQQELEASKDRKLKQSEPGKQTGILRENLRAADREDPLESTDELLLSGVMLSQLREICSNALASHQRDGPHMLWEKFETRD